MVKPLDRHTSAMAFRRFVRQKPLQATKLVSILLILVFAVLGFFRVISLDAVIDNPLIADGQFLTLVLVPVVSLGLIAVVACETLVTGIRAIRADQPILDQVTSRPGYMVVRGLEAGAALLGVVLIASAVPILVADSTPSPIGVGLMLGLLVVGIGIFLASLARTIIEFTSIGKDADSQ